MLIQLQSAEIGFISEILDVENLVKYTSALICP